MHMFPNTKSSRFRQTSLMMEIPRQEHDEADKMTGLEC